MFYSKSTGGFYAESIHGARTVEMITTDPDTGKTLDCWNEPNPDCKIPADAVEITADDHAALMAGQSMGKRIVADINGSPVLADQPAPTPAQIWERIKVERDRRTETGGYMVGTKWFHSDQKSRSQQLGLMLLGANIPPNTPWQTMDGTAVIMTQTLAGQILAAAAASDIAIFGVARQHKAAMEANADPSAYDFTTGWPLMYGEV